MIGHAARFATPASSRTELNAKPAEPPALVGVEDLGVAGRAPLEGLDAEVGIKGVGEPPREHLVGAQSITAGRHKLLAPIFFTVISLKL